VELIRLSDNEWVKFRTNHFTIKQIHLPVHDEFSDTSRGSVKHKIKTLSRF